MEALVLIVVELLAVAAYAMFGVCAALAAAVVDLAALLLASLFGVAFAKRPSRAEAQSTAAQPVSTQTERPAKTRRRHLLLIPLGLLAGMSMVINFVFFETATRWAVENLAGKAGFAVEFETVEGSIYSGRFSFRNLAVARESGERAGYDLQIGQAALDVNLWSLIFRPIRLESVGIESVSGQITKPAGQEGSEDRAKDGSGKLKPKRRFVVDRLEIQDARLRIIGEDGTDSEVEVVHAQSEPFRSDLAVFDFFFRSTVDMRVDGHPVRITTEELETGRRTFWDIDDFPVSSVAGLVPKPPIDWFEGGTISARVEDEWSRSEAETAIDMDWSIVLRGVTVNVPPDARPVEKITASALAKVVNGRTDDVTFDFKMVFDEENFRNSVSLDSAGLWKALVIGAAKSIAARYGGKAPVPEDQVEGLGSRLKSLLGKEQPEEQLQ